LGWDPKRLLLWEEEGVKKFLSNDGPGEKVKSKLDDECLILYDVLYASALIEDGSWVGRADPTYKQAQALPAQKSMLGRSTR
jgi:hypothetical protein